MNEKLDQMSKLLRTRHPVRHDVPVQWNEFLRELDQKTAKQPQTC